MKNEAFGQQDRTLRRYLNPELLIIDDFGLKQLPKNSGKRVVGNPENALIDFSLEVDGIGTIGIISTTQCQ